MTGQTASGGDSHRPAEQGTRAEIMDATYTALGKHGYADLTIQTIADEFSKSKSLLYYHYDAKDDLLVDFLDWLVEEFASEVGADPAGNPEDRVRDLFGMLVPEDDGSEGIRLSLLELRMRAPRDDRFAERFEALDERVREEFAAAIREGIARDRFRDVDAEFVADNLYSLATGATVRQLTTDYDGESAQRGLDDIIDRLRA
ncbi:TetR/AcrR family transcriptional regulator [Haloglomus halophilum]|uniref:TetR/AcrR family transcriptional regulator n=1 Tax=Haloglomus halophilum TaxID=2962672 RepID=UPI0020C9F9E9|nr:TetR/AcrR family transcriptional regulator [Haloglomus halophilum]